MSLQIGTPTVFIGVNGTLIPNGTRRTAFSPANLARFRSSIAALSETGMQVGLCSDSPLLQLQKFGTLIGLDARTAPVLAENGNVFSANGQTTVLRDSSVLVPLRAHVEEVARHEGLQQHADVVSPEIGDQTLRISVNQWAFGANRLASLSLFGPRGFIEAMAQEIPQWARDRNLTLGVSLRADSNNLLVHPYNPVIKGKGLALRELSIKQEIVMIGSSRADWVGRDSSVRCAFVAGAQIPAAILQQAWVVAGQPVFNGVLEVLDYIRSTRAAAASVDI